MAKKSIAKRAAAPKESSKEAKKIKKLQEEKRELQKQLREAKKTIQKLEKDAVTEKKRMEEENKKFEEQKKLDIENAVFQAELENDNSTKSFMESIDELKTVSEQLMRATSELSKMQLEDAQKFVDEIKRTTQFCDKSADKAFHKVLDDAKEELAKCSDLWQDLQGFFEKFQELAVRGNPLCKKCREECEEHPVNPDRDLQNTSPTCCQICLLKFSENPGKVPRILRCGHSICESCIDMMKVGYRVKCPYDRKQTLLPYSQAFYLPKNFTTLAIINTMPKDEVDEEVEMA